jgi:hypothetical protein
MSASRLRDRSAHPLQFAAAMKRALVLVSLAGCSLYWGDHPPPPPACGTVGGPADCPQPGTAFDFFVKNVDPLLGKCSGCHVGPERSATDMFLGPTNTVDGHYDAVVADRGVTSSRPGRISSRA